MRAPSDAGETRKKDKGRESGKEVVEEGSEHGGVEDPHANGDKDGNEEPSTDPDAWVYADNKWEGGGAKGGLGKVCARSLARSLFVRR